MNDRRVGPVLRALRRQRGWRQIDLADLSGLSQSAISMIERGHWTSLSVKTLRHAFATVDASSEGLVGWRGGSLDRLLAERHAALVEQVVAVLQTGGGEVAVEVSYQVYGERGSIDILAIDRRKGTALVIEIKTEIASAEETIRRLDAKSRLATRVCLERFGWRPRIVARCLVLPEGETHRRRVRALGATFSVSFPMRVARSARGSAHPRGPFRRSGSSHLQPTWWYATRGWFAAGPATTIGGGLSVGKRKRSSRRAGRSM
jgi:transcriptional regulator with XRE-family HTH domain